MDFYKFEFVIANNKEELQIAVDKYVNELGYKLVSVCPFIDTVVEAVEPEGYCYTVQKTRLYVTFEKRI